MPTVFFCALHRCSHFASDIAKEKKEASTSKKNLKGNINPEIPPGSYPYGGDVWVSNTQKKPSNWLPNFLGLVLLGLVILAIVNAIQGK